MGFPVVRGISAVVSSRKAEFYLLMVTMIWGLTFPLIGAAVKSVNPIDFVFMRFVLAALILLPWVLKDLKSTDSMTLLYGLLLGILNVAVYSFQSMGLQTIGSAQSAFITAISVILVPFLLLFFRNHSVKWLDFFCSGLCLAGLYILTGAHLISLNSGEILTLGCAIGSAFTIITIQLASRKVQKVELLVFYQIVFTALLAWPLSMQQGGKIIWNSQIVFALLFCSILATVVVFYWQLKYQKYTTATKTALIFCAEPFFACLFAWIINGERLSLSTLVGGILIVLSMVLPDLLKLNVKKPPVPA